MRRHSAEEKIRIILVEMSGEDSIIELYNTLNQNIKVLIE
jgi:hypothetical protein